MSRQPLEGSMDIEVRIQAMRSHWIDQVKGLAQEAGLPEHTLDPLVDETERRVRRKEELKAGAYQKVLQSRSCGNCSGEIKVMTPWNRQSIAVCPLCLAFLDLAHLISIYGLSAEDVLRLGRRILALLEDMLTGPDDVVPMLPDGDIVLARL